MLYSWRFQDASRRIGALLFHKKGEEQTAKEKIHCSFETPLLSAFSGKCGCSWCALDLDIKTQLRLVV
jgi:hypothetical protein